MVLTKPRIAAPAVAASKEMSMRIPSLACAALVVALMPAAAFAQAVTLRTTLAGPDPDGSGSASVKVDGAQVCYDLKVAGIAPATAAPNHKAAAGANGPPVVPLTAPASGSSAACVAVDAAVAADIAANPQGYYVNVHTPEFPPGAVRGQLSK
jgi:hypothetical protein